MDMTRHSALKPLVIATVIPIVAVLFSQCRTARKTSGADDPLTFKVQLQGIEPGEFTNYGLGVQLTDCADSVGQPSAKDPLVYQFQAPKIQKNSVCGVLVRGIGKSGERISFFDGTPQGVFYVASNVVIETSVDGGLMGRALLQKRFAVLPPEKDPADKRATLSWSLALALRANTPFTETCTCQLACQPKLNNDTMPLKITSSPKDGVCQFQESSTESLSEKSCDTVQVQCKGQLFEANLTPKLRIGLANLTHGPVDVKLAEISADGSVTVIPEIKR